MFIHNGKEVEIVLPIAPVKALGRDFSPGVGRCSSRAVCSEQRCTGLGFDANVLLGWIWGLSVRWVAFLCPGPRGDSHRVLWPALVYLFKTERGVYTNPGQ